MMNKIIINENQKGLLFKNGKYVKLLDAGKYYLFGGRRVEIYNTKSELFSDRCDLEILLKDKNISDSTVTVEVKDEQIALHYVNGKFAHVLLTGKHTFWKASDEHEFQLIDVSTPEVDESVPKYVFSKIPTSVYTKVEVSDHEKAIVYFDKKLHRVLDSGTYYFWKTPIKVETFFVDMRLTQMDITGQEILTADKVTLRINFVCNYRVTDFLKITSEVDDFREQMHVASQLALREYVGKYKLDEILENKEEISEVVFKKLKEKEKDLFVEIKYAGIKDIILPGEIRDIMNTVLVAEKRAQANVITRREEVASTRSLLNTAKLMDENKTLYKLKELEYVERICENVGHISLNGNGNLLSQLTSVLNGKAD
jgi:regulator of protease activity HflC (stomatin/prohibitin superfamily)